EGISRAHVSGNRRPRRLPVEHGEDAVVSGIDGAAARAGATSGAGSVGMNMENFCTYTDGREAAIVSYLYGELPPDERAAFERHLSACVACRAELGGLEELRSDLAAWHEPDVTGDIAVRTAAPAPVVPITTARS